MPPKTGIPFEEPVQSSNYHVIKGDIKKNKSVISSQLTTLNKEMTNLRKTPAPTLYRKWSHMATIDHCRSAASTAMNHLRDLNINAEGILNELTPKSTEEVNIIQATRRELQEGELKYWGLLEKFDEAN